MLHFSIPLDDLDGKIFGNSPIATTTTSTTTTPSPSTTTKTTTTSGPHPKFNESGTNRDCHIPYPVLMNLVALNNLRGSRITIDDVDTTQSSSRNPTPGVAQTNPIHLSMTSNFWEVAAATGLTSFIGLLVNLIIFCCAFRARACARRRPSKFLQLALLFISNFNFSRFRRREDHSSPVWNSSSSSDLFLIRQACDYCQPLKCDRQKGPTVSHLSLFLRFSNPLNFFRICESLEHLGTAHAEGLCLTERIERAAENIVTTAENMTTRDSRNKGHKFRPRPSAPKPPRKHR